MSEMTSGQITSILLGGPILLVVISGMIGLYLHQRHEARSIRMEIHSEIAGLRQWVRRGFRD